MDRPFMEVRPAVVLILARSERPGSNSLEDLGIRDELRFHVGKNEGVPPIRSVLGLERTIRAVGHPKSSIFVSLFHLERETTRRAYPVWLSFSLARVPNREDTWRETQCVWKGMTELEPQMARHDSFGLLS